MQKLTTWKVFFLTLFTTFLIIGMEHLEIKRYRIIEKRKDITTGYYTIKYIDQLGKDTISRKYLDWDQVDSITYAHQ